MKTVTSKNDSAAKTMRTRSRFFLRIEPPKSQVQAVQVLPHLARNAIANGPRVFARLGDALHDGTWVVGIEGQKFKDVMRGRFRIKLAKESFFACHGKNGLPSHAVRLLHLFQ